MSAKVSPIRHGITLLAAPQPAALPGTLRLLDRDDGRHFGLHWQLSLKLRSDAEGFVSAGIVTPEQLDSLPACGQRSFDRYFSPEQQNRNSDNTRVTIKRLKHSLQAEVVVYGASNPELNRYVAWAGLSNIVGRPALRLVIDNARRHTCPS